MTNIDNPTNRTSVMDDQDRQLFRDLIQDVTAIKGDQANPVELARLKRTYRKNDRSKRTNDLALNQNIHSPRYTTDREYIEPIGPESQIFFQIGSLPRKRVRQLTSGSIPIEDHLDLHGFTIACAATELDQFLEKAKQQGKRCVRIIHGKGGNRSLNDQKKVAGHTAQVAVIKSAINHWLRDDHRILAFCSAKPEDGGKGAIYVLLKNHSPDSKRPQ